MKVLFLYIPRLTNGSSFIGFNLTFDERVTTVLSDPGHAPGTRRGQGSHGQHHCHHDDHPLGKARGGDDDFYFRNSPSLNSLRVLSGRQGSLHVR